MYLRTTLFDSSSLFVCLTLFLIIFLYLHCPNLSQFWHSFCTIGTILGPIYFSTAVASAGCFFFFVCFFFFLVVTSLPALKFWVIMFFSLFYQRLRSMLDFPYVNNTRLLDIFWVFSDPHYPLTVFSQFWSVRSGSFFYFDKTLRLIFASFADTRPCANIRNLKLSADNSPCLKSSQFLLTTEANPK